MQFKHYMYDSADESDLRSSWGNQEKGLIVVCLVIALDYIVLLIGGTQDKKLMTRQDTHKSKF